MALLFGTVPIDPVERTNRVDCKQGDLVGRHTLYVIRGKAEDCGCERRGGRWSEDV